MKFTFSAMVIALVSLVQSAIAFESGVENLASPFGKPRLIESVSKDPAVTRKLFSIKGVQAGSSNTCNLFIFVSDQQQNVERNGEKYRGMNVYLALEIQDLNLVYNRFDSLSYERFLFPMNQGSGVVDLGTNMLRKQYASSQLIGNLLVNESAYVQYSEPQTLSKKNMTVEFSKDLTKVVRVTATVKTISVLQKESTLGSQVCEF